jgi:serine/threonine protein kinase
MAPVLYEHDAGIRDGVLAIMQVHMDVKSPNVLLGRNNLAKLADVGLAKFLHKDYLSVAKSVGTFAWSVSPSHLPNRLPAGTRPKHTATRAGCRRPPDRQHETSTCSHACPDGRRRRC